MPKLLFVVTEDWYFVSHRLGIARAARDAGFDVAVATRVQQDGARLAEEGFRVIPLSMRRRSNNVFREVWSLVELIAIYRREKPDIVHHVALKPMLFGSLAAAIVGLPTTINAVAGMGYFFTSGNWKARLLRPFIQVGLRLLLNRPHRCLILQNLDDLQLLHSINVVDQQHVALIRGSGVNVEYFQPMPEPEPEGEVTVAVVARMLWDKGIHNLVDAVRIARAQGENIKLLLVGAPDPENPAAIPIEKLEEWNAEEGIEWLGFQRDIREIWARAHIAALPSRREGLPKSLLEAAACGRPMIATDVPGCREVVRDGENGFLVPDRDVRALADALVLLARDPELRARFGRAGREIAEREFGDSLVIAKHLDLYRQMLRGEGPGRHPLPARTGLRILFVADNFPPETNAAATRVYERACYWAKWGHEVTVITCAPNFPTGRLFPGYENRWYHGEMMAGIKVVRVKTFITANAGVLLRTLDFLSFMVTAVAAGLIQKRPDVICATSPQFFAAVGGWILGGLRRVPFVFELGDLWPASIVAVGALNPSLPVRWLEKLELFLYRRSAAVVALTKAFKLNLTRRGIDPGKVAVVMNGVDLPRYAPRPRDAELAEEWRLGGKFVVGYIGTHGMAHALANVLNAAERLRQHDDLRFVLIGAGAERDMLINDAKARGIDNVVFIPPQPKERMPQLWSLCDVALVHLKNSAVFEDVIPSKMFEAMGMGLPLLLASPSGEAKTILETDNAGLWVPAEDPDALAQAVLKLKDDPELRARLAAQSHAAAPLHTREHQATSMLQVLSLVTAGRGSETGAIAEVRQ